MIKNHRDIINLWRSPTVLAKRINDEYVGIFTKQEITALGKALRMARERNSINSRHWNYICRVAASDYEKGRIENLVTLDLLMDTK